MQVGEMYMSVTISLEALNQSGRTRQLESSSAFVREAQPKHGRKASRAISGDSWRLGLQVHHDLASPKTLSEASHRVFRRHRQRIRSLLHRNVHHAMLIAARASSICKCYGRELPLARAVHRFRAPTPSPASLNASLPHQSPPMLLHVILMPSTLEPDSSARLLGADVTRSSQQWLACAR